MKLTKGRKKDLETILYFLEESWTEKYPITDRDIEMFFEYSEQGKYKDKIKVGRIENGFDLLVQGKRWRGIHIHELYERGILDVPYYVLLGGYEGEKAMPRAVVDFMKKEMFKGADSELIESTYQEILKEKK